MSIILISCELSKQVRAKMKHLFLLSLFISSAIQAGNTTGKIGTVFVHEYNSIVLFNMASSSQGMTGCATTKRYSINTDTQAGKNLFSAILAAKAAAQTVTVIGKNVCELHGDAENIQYIYIN